MYKAFRSALLVALSSLSMLSATPTSIFWTNCTTDTVEPKVIHFDFDNFFSLGNRTVNGSSFPPDIGVTTGFLFFDKVGAECGVDYLGGIKDPWLFNGKLALAEGKLFDQSPSFSIGIFNVGTSHDTNQEVFDFVVGHSLPNDLGSLFLGLYHGKHAIGKDRSGWMIGYQKVIYRAKDEKGNSYDKWTFNADYSSGKNANGGGGVAMTYNFTPTVNVETGPVWFSDTKENGRWKWSVQIGIDI